MKLIEYDREKACNYAEKWALLRNSNYLNFDGIGGDCTNFASQCLYAGVGVMNYTKDVGWYYNSPGDRAAAWSDAGYFRKFMLTNNSIGPIGVARSINSLDLGDFISLDDGTHPYHTLIVTGFHNNTPLVCAHTDDAYMRSIETYNYISAFGIHIIGANTY